MPVSKDSTSALTIKIVAELSAEAVPQNLPGMARFGINTSNSLGLSMPLLRGYARQYRKNHELAMALWNTGIHEMRILASIVADPKKLTEAQMESWVHDFDSWDVCDQCCSNLFRKSPLALEKAIAWTRSHDEFVKRAGFVMMATLAVHDKKSPDHEFLSFLQIIEKGASDERNFVKKAVNWALRQIGKRNKALNAAAIECAGKILTQNTKTARWIANDALRELTSEAVQARLTGRPVSRVRL